MGNLVQVIIRFWAGGSHWLRMKVKLLFISLIVILINHILHKSINRPWVECIHDRHELNSDYFFPIQIHSFPFLIILVHNLLDQLFKIRLYQHFVFGITFIVNGQIFYERGWNSIFSIIKWDQLRFKAGMFVTEETIFLKFS